MQHQHALGLTVLMLKSVLLIAFAGAASDDISISTIDVSKLDADDAISKLLAQNQALTAHASRLKNIR